MSGISYLAGCLKTVAVAAMAFSLVNNTSAQGTTAKQKTSEQASNRVSSIKPISIASMGMFEVKHGTVFEFQPKISGDVNICRKDLGHDDVAVDPITGKITWDTGKLLFGRGFHIRIKCSNYVGSAYASMVVHVDKSGDSRLRVAGKDGYPKYIAEAGHSMDSGDTVVIPDGVYPVSVDDDESFENAFKETTPTPGSKAQFSTIMAESPGGVIISGAPHGDIGKQKNAFQLPKTKYIAIVGFVVKDVQRESFTTVGPTKNVLLDFFGAAGAGTWGFPCDNFENAKPGQCSNAGIRFNGGNPLIQNSYDWGHNRYGIMTRGTRGSITRRSLVRLDEHRGSQPYGGFSDYCARQHLSQDNTIFDSLAIAAPHYKNYAGLSAYPATGCQKKKSSIKTIGLLAVNNELSLSLMDSKAGPPHEWRNIVSYDNEGTCTPAKNRCAAWLLQAKKKTLVTDSFFGKARGFKGSLTGRPPYDYRNVELSDSVVFKDIPGYPDKGEAPRYLPQSQLYFNGRMDTFLGDKGFNDLTQTRRWPIPGEDIIARNMRSYFNPKALKVGGGFVEIDGNRGAVKEGRSMSEYFWGYLDPKIPPLVVRAKKIGQDHKVVWEHFTGKTRQQVIGWQVACADNHKIIAKLKEHQLSFIDRKASCNAYTVQAVYAEGVSGIAYIEKVR